MYNSTCINAIWNFNTIIMGFTYLTFKSLLSLNRAFLAWLQSDLTGNFKCEHIGHILGSLCFRIIFKVLLLYFRPHKSLFSLKAFKCQQSSQKAKNKRRAHFCSSEVIKPATSACTKPTNCYSFTYNPGGQLCGLALNLSLSYFF